jgi:hypothetical protein
VWIIKEENTTVPQPEPLYSSNAVEANTDVYNIGITKHF